MIGYFFVCQPINGHQAIFSLVYFLVAELLPPPSPRGEVEGSPPDFEVGVKLKN